MRRLPVRRTKFVQPSVAVSGNRMVLVVPIQVRSESNDRGHWGSRHRRFKEHATAIRALWGNGGDALGAGPWVVTLTKIGGKRLDSDNLAGSGKGIRDCIASLLGVDDGDTSRVSFRYEQEPGGGPIGVRVTIEGKL